MEKDLLMDLSFDLRPTMIDQLKALLEQNGVGQ